MLNKENLVLIVSYTTKFPSLCRSTFVETIVLLYLMSEVLKYYPTIYFFNYYAILELIMALLDSFTFPNSNTPGWITDELPKEFPKNIKSETASDILECAKAHEQIEKGDAKKITPFVSYTEHVNEKNGKKTTAGQVNVPFFDKIRGCVTAKDIDKPSDTGLSQAGGC